jgi:hypothetical protein
MEAFDKQNISNLYKKKHRHNLYKLVKLNYLIFFRQYSIISIQFWKLKTRETDAKINKTFQMSAAELTT